VIKDPFENKLETVFVEVRILSSVFNISSALQVEFDLKFILCRIGGLKGKKQNRKAPFRISQDHSLEIFPWQKTKSFNRRENNCSKNGDISFFFQ